MSDFLANLARRGAGLAPHTPLHPSLTPFVSPEAAVAAPIERGMEDHLDAGEHTPPTPEPGAVANAAGDAEREAGESLGISTASEPMVQRRIAESSMAQPAPVPAMGTGSPVPPVQLQTSPEVTPSPPILAPGEPAPLPGPPRPAPRFGEPGFAQPEVAATANSVEAAESPDPTGSSDSDPGRKSTEPPRVPEPSSLVTSEPKTVEPKQTAQPQTAKLSPSPLTHAQRAPAPLPPSVTANAAQEPLPQHNGFSAEMGTFPAVSAEGAMSAGLTQLPASPSSQASGLLPSTQATARAKDRAVQIEPALPPPVSLELVATRQPPPTPMEPVTSATTVEPQPVQIRIGTVEVRATTPPPAPPPAPAPQGFDDYVHIRTYQNWDV